MGKVKVKDKDKDKDKGVLSSPTLSPIVPRNHASATVTLLLTQAIALLK